MGRMLKIEFERAFRGKLWIILLIGVAIVGADFIQYVLPEVKFMNTALYWTKMERPQTAFQWWIGGGLIDWQQVLFFYLMPLMTAIPYADSFFTDRKNGYIKNIFTRTTKSRYYAAKYLATFVVSGLVVVIPMLLSFALTASVLPMVKPDVNGFMSPIMHGQMWDVLYYSHPLIYTFAYIAVDFVYAGLFASMALTVAFFVEYRFAVLLAPFLLVFFLRTICSFFGWNTVNILRFLSPGNSFSDGSFWIVACEALIIAMITGGIFFGKGLHDDVY